MHRFINIGVLSVVIVLLTVLWIAAITFYTRPSVGELVLDSGEIFVPYNGNGIHHMRDVCIEPDPMARKVEIHARYKLGKTVDLARKLIVIYNSAEDKTVKYKVGSANPFTRDWPLTFKTGPPPSTHTYKDYPAYFVITRCPGNMFHYVMDSLSQLYWTMKVTHRLNSTTPNMVYFQQPMAELHQKANGTGYCYNPASFAPLLTSFSVREDFDSYHKAPDNICYRNAIFGQGEGVSPTEVAQYVTNKLNFDNSRCGEGPVVTILQRSHRRILNEEELKSAAIKAGFNTTVVNFEHLPFIDQLSHIACTDILVGVHGAGLQWNMFLRPKRALLEIAWPSKGWPFFYSNYRPYFSFNWPFFHLKRDLPKYKLEASEVKLNFDSFAAECTGNVPVSEEEKSWLASQGPIRNSYNQWKWADCVVNPLEFANKLSEINGLITT